MGATVVWGVKEELFGIPCILPGPASPGRTGPEIPGLSPVGPTRVFGCPPREGVKVTPRAGVI